MQINIVTLFPEYFSSPLKTSLLGKAIQNGLLSVTLTQLRDFSNSPHRKVDDQPYGGGPGMVMSVEPFARAIDSIREKDAKTHVVLLSARGRMWNNALAQNYLDRGASLTLLCGHYEGVDERVAEHLCDDSIRVGNYVLSGGEPAAMIVVDSLARRIKGFMGNQDSIKSESFEDENHEEFEYAQYTRPEHYNGWSVPPVLLSGDHKKIEAWRKQNAAESQKYFNLKNNPD